MIPAVFRCRGDVLKKVTVRKWLDTKDCILILDYTYFQKYWQYHIENSDGEYIKKKVVQTLFFQLHH